MSQEMLQDFSFKEIFLCSFISFDGIKAMVNKKVNNNAKMNKSVLPIYFFKAII